MLGLWARGKEPGGQGKDPRGRWCWAMEVRVLGLGGERAKSRMRETDGARESKGQGGERAKEARVLVRGAKARMLGQGENVGPRRECWAKESGGQVWRPRQGAWSLRQGFKEPKARRQGSKARRRGARIAMSQGKEPGA